MASSADLDTIAARLRAFVRTADPDHVWPDVPRAARLDGHRRIVSATRAALLGRAAFLEAKDDATARAIGIAAFESGMGPLLGWWGEHGLLRTTPRLAPILATHLAHGRARAAKLRAVTVAVIRALRERGVTPVLLKGAHTGDAYFPEPGTRAGTDIDLLVKPSQLELAREALRACGLIESRRTDRPFRSDWTPIGDPQPVRSLEFTHTENPWAIDLHISLEKHYVGNLRARLSLPEPDQLSEYHLDGQVAAVLRHPLLAAYLAIHAGWLIHELQLVRLVELSMVLRADAAQERLDPSVLVSLLRRTDTDHFAYPALALAEHLVPGTVSTRVLDAVTAGASRSARQVVASLAASRAYRLPRRSVEEKFMWARGLREHLQVATDVAWPFSDQLEHARRWALIRRRVRMLLGGRAGLRAPRGPEPQDRDQAAGRD